MERVEGDHLFTNKLSPRKIHILLTDAFIFEKVKLQAPRGSGHGLKVHLVKNFREKII